MIVKVLRNGTASGESNMLADREMANAVANDNIHVGFRTYTWAPWCVSLGKNQDQESINSDACKALGYDVVRRPTGGRAVLHANELTYCLAVKLMYGKTAREVYQMIHTEICRALSTLSTDLRCTNTASDLRVHYASSGFLGRACFTAHTKSEIVAGERKVVGSAQWIDNGTLLQHGSILCNVGHEQIAELIAGPDGLQSEMLSGLRKSSTTLTELVGREVTADEVADLLHKHISEALLRDYFSSSADK